MKKLQTLREIKREVIFRRLRACQWNQVYAAKTLGMSIRSMRENIQSLREWGYLIPSARGRLKKELAMEVTSDFSQSHAPTLETSTSSS